MKLSIHRVENKIKQLKRNHHDDDIVVIKNEPFLIEKLYEEEGANPLPVATTEKHIPKIKDSDDFTMVQNSLETEKRRTNKVTEKLNKPSVWNTNKNLNVEMKR